MCIIYIPHGSDAETMNPVYSFIHSRRKTMLNSDRVGHRNPDRKTYILLLLVYTQNIIIYIHKCSLSKQLSTFNTRNFPFNTLNICVYNIADAA